MTGEIHHKLNGGVHKRGKTQSGLFPKQHQKKMRHDTFDFLHKRIDAFNNSVSSSLIQDFDAFLASLTAIPLLHQQYAVPNIPLKISALDHLKR